MISFEELKAAFDEGKRIYEAIINGEGPYGDLILDERAFTLEESYELSEEGVSKGDCVINTIASGDNLAFMADLIKNREMAGKLQLIYVDPPFFSKGKYEASVRIDSQALGKSKVMKLGAYDDRWERGLKQYLSMLTARFFMMRDLLSESGLLWVHLDWHVVHYVKIILDSIFGSENFINEVIWTYKSGGSSKRSFAKKHDNLLLYGKTANYIFEPLKEKSYNRDYKPYNFKGVEEFQDETGWYTMVNMKDVWSIDMVGRTSAERNGYATQKPEKLLERIIESCSMKGDICADFFSGSGTLGAVCEKMGRKWIMCDESSLATSCQIERMADLGADFKVIRQRNAAGNKDTQRLGTIEVKMLGDVLSLTGYSIDTSLYQADIRAEINAYVKGDSLSLIRRWSVDTNHDGRIHKTCNVMTGREQEVTLDIHKENSKINILGYDIFGNRFIKQLER